ncbi:MAG: histidine kinase [Novosphingobium sp.]
MATHPDALSELPPRPHVPARQVLLSASALWLTYFLLITVRGVVVDMGEFHELLWRRALVTIAGIAITLLVWPVLRRFDGRSSALRIAVALVIMLPAALALAAINQQCFAPVEQKLIEREAKKAQAQAEAAAKAIRAGQGAGAGSNTAGPIPTIPIVPTVRVRHDVSGNVLIDVADPPPVPSLLSEPPEPPAPPASPKVSRANKAPPLPATADPSEAEEDPEADSLITAPGGVSILRRADGTAEIRVGNRIVVTDVDHADEVAEDLADARRDIARAHQLARQASEDAQAALADTLRHDVLRSLADEGLIPEAQVPPAPPGTAPRPPRARHAAARPKPFRPAPAVKAAPTSSSPVPGSSPASEPAVVVATAPPASELPPQLASVVIRKMIEDEGLWKQLTDVALGRYFLLIAWAALYVALGNAEVARASERREGEYKRAAKAAELRSLRYQVNPHFLFNTLNSLSALVMVGRSEQAEKMIQTISSFYRHSLAGDPTADVPLADEIALQRHYLEIETVRFPERLVCEFDVPEALENACVPGMILQPLVENSIKYGVSASTRPVTIRIAAEEAGGMLVMTVADDGPGKSGQQGGTGIGLENVRSRLAARFGDLARVESGSLPAGGYATVLTIPIVRAGCD